MLVFNKLVTFLSHLVSYLPTFTPFVQTIRTKLDTLVPDHEEAFGVKIGDRFNLIAPFPKKKKKKMEPKPVHKLVSIRCCTKLYKEDEGQ